MAKDSRDLLGTSPEILGAAWFDPIEAMIRDRVRGFIENLVEAELETRSGAGAISVLEPRMWRAEQPVIVGVEHANCLVRLAQDDQCAARTAERS